MKDSSVQYSINSEIVDKEALKRNLKKNGISLTAIATQIGKDRNYFSSKLHDCGAISKEDVKAIEELGKVSPKIYVTGERKVELTSPRNRRHINRIRLNKDLFVMEFLIRGLKFKHTSLACGFEQTYFSKKCRNGYITLSDSVMLDSLYGIKRESYEETEENKNFDPAKWVFVNREFFEKELTKHGINKKALSTELKHDKNYIEGMLTCPGAITEFDALFLDRKYGIKKSSYEDKEFDGERRVYVDVVRFKAELENNKLTTKSLSVEMGREEGYLDQRLYDGTITELDALYLLKKYGIKKSAYEDTDPLNKELENMLLEAKEKEETKENSGPFQPAIYTESSPLSISQIVPSTARVVDVAIDYEKLEEAVRKANEPIVTCISQMYENLEEIIYRSAQYGVEKAWVSKMREELEESTNKAVYDAVKKAWSE